MALLLLALLLVMEPSCEGLRGAPKAGGAGEGGGSGPPLSLAGLAALLSDTLIGEMPSAIAVYNQPKKAQTTTYTSGPFHVCMQAPCVSHQVTLAVKIGLGTVRLKPKV